MKRLTDSPDRHRGLFLQRIRGCGPLLMYLSLFIVFQTCSWYFPEISCLYFWESRTQSVFPVRIPCGILSEGVSVFKDLHGHPVLKWDVVHVGILLSPHMVVFMYPGKLWKKKRVTRLLVWITVLLTVTDTSSRVRLRLGGYRVLTITVGNKVRMDVPEEDKWRRRPGNRVL